MEKTRPDGRRLRLWILVSGAAMAVLLLFQLFVLDELVEAVHRREPFGPLDFSKLEGVPKKSIAVAQQWQSWSIAGWLTNGLLSWGLLAAALFPKRTLAWSQAFSRRRSVAGVAVGLAAAALGLARFTLENATGATWMLVAFAGLCLAGASSGVARTPRMLGRLCGVAAIATLAGITLPALLRSPAPLDMIYKEDALFELLQAQLYAMTALLFFLARKNAPQSARLLLLLGAAGFAFVAAEEVSWGQRFLKFDTPDFWESTHGETTLHNLPAIARMFRYSVVLVPWGILSIAAALVPAIRRQTETWGVPVVPLVGVVAMVAGLIVHTPAHHDWYQNTDEIQETLGALAAVSAGFLVRYRTAGLLGERSTSLPEATRHRAVHM